MVYPSSLMHKLINLKLSYVDHGGILMFDVSNLLYSMEPRIEPWRKFSFIQ